MKSLKMTLAVAAVGAVAFAGAAQARDQIKIVGSSTVFPFSTAVAETFGKTSPFPTPVVESTGSGGGLKLFCAGVGVEHPDITNASRRIKSSEVELCAENGVNDIVEVKVGYDGIVLANAAGAELVNLEKKHIFLALAAEVPGPDGALIPNPNMKWSDIDPSLPAMDIEVLGPPPTSGTRDAFVELAMEGGAKEIPAMAELRKSDKKAFEAAAGTMREDGAFVEAGENDNLIVSKLAENPARFGIFGFSFLDQNADKVQGATIGGVAPTFENIASGDYKVSRSLFFYVKKAHVGVVPGIEEFLAEFTKDGTWGDDGYLSEKGLIPMPAEERAKYTADVKGLVNLSM
jgi:phosphate transport system substrate-binding protein